MTPKEWNTMVTSEQKTERFLTLLSNGKNSIVADAPFENGGGARGFGPHELLEAALAACISMTVRMYASHHRIPLEGVTCAVRMIRKGAAAVRFEHTLELLGGLSATEHETLHDVARASQMHQTLSSRIEFQAVSG
jgi:putative redox protein